MPVGILNPRRMTPRQALHLHRTLRGLGDDASAPTQFDMATLTPASGTGNATSFTPAQVAASEAATQALFQARLAAQGGQNYGSQDWQYMHSTITPKASHTPLYIGLALLGLGGILMLKARR